MRFLRAVVLAATLPCSLSAAGALAAPTVKVGRGLAKSTAVRLPEPAPAAGVEITLASDDPTRLLLARTPDQAGSATITIKVLPRFVESAEFWVQGLADRGTVTYTASVPGIGSTKGTVTLAPSALVVIGPMKAPKVPVTTGGEPVRVTIVSAALDPSGKVVDEQPLAGGFRLEVGLKSSNPAVGKLKTPTVTLVGGASTAVSYFQPAAEGDTTLTPSQPPGFSAPAEFASIVISVMKPGLAIVGDLYVGKDLQVPAVLCLGEPAPPGGLKVTLTSSDGSKLLLSDAEGQTGSAIRTLTVPEGGLTARYYLHGIDDSGIVTYKATAPGFRSRSADVGLAPSGVIVAYEHYGPPDEASVLRNSDALNDREFFASVADAQTTPVHVVVYTVYLDPKTGRAADITVQPLRPGVELNVDLTSSNPAIGTVESPLKIKSGADHVAARFSPLSAGNTAISIGTPAGFSKPKNATSIHATVSN